MNRALKEILTLFGIEEYAEATTVEERYRYVFTSQYLLKDMFDYFFAAREKHLSELGSNLNEKF